MVCLFLWFLLALGDLVWNFTWEAPKGATYTKITKMVLDPCIHASSYTSKVYPLGDTFKSQDALLQRVSLALYVNTENNDARSLPFRSLSKVVKHHVKPYKRPSHRRTHTPPPQIHSGNSDEREIHSFYIWCLLTSIPSPNPGKNPLRQLYWLGSCSVVNDS